MRPFLTVVCLTCIFPLGMLQAADPLYSFDTQIAIIQQRIAEADGLDGYYATEYRQAETSYWAQIPAWMKEDSLSIKGHRAQILDVGCGYGTLLSLAVEIYHGQGHCLDISEYLPLAVRARYGLGFTAANIELAPFPGGSLESPDYDVIIMTEVIEHFNFHPLPTLRKLHAKLVPGGSLFLSTPDAEYWGRLYDFHQHLEDFRPPSNLTEEGKHPETTDEHHWMYSREEITSVLESAGFQVVKIEHSPGVRGLHFNIHAIRH